MAAPVLIPLGTRIAVPAIVTIAVIAIPSVRRILGDLIHCCERMVKINTKEQELEFEKRANQISEELEALGDTRVHHLDARFEGKGISTARKPKFGRKLSN